MINSILLFLIIWIPLGFALYAIGAPYTSKRQDIHEASSLSAVDDEPLVPLADNAL